MDNAVTYKVQPALRVLPIVFFCLLTTFFLLGCGAETDSENGSQGQGGDTVETPKKWASQKIIQLDATNGILTPRVEAQPGKAGEVHISYFDGSPREYNVNHLVFDSKDPLSAKKSVVKTIDNCSGLSLTLGTDGIPVVGYQGGVKRETGNSEQSDAMLSVGENDWVEYTAGIGFVERNPVWKDGLAGSDLSVALDSNGDIHMVYQFSYEGIDAYNFDFPDLLYVKKARGNLSETVVEETVEGNFFYENGTAGAQNNVGSFSTVVIDSNDQPVVFYYYAHETTNNRGLKVAYRENGTWVSGWVEKGVEIGGISRAHLDKNGKPGVAYFVREAQNGEKNYLRYAHQETQFSFALATVEDSIQAGRYPSLSFDSNGRPAIAYYAEQTYTKRDLKDLRLSRFDGVSWEHENVAVDGDIGLYNSLWFNEGGQPLIVTYSNTEKAIMLYSKIP